MAFFLKLKLNYVSKMLGYPQFSFLDTKSTYEDLLSPDSLNRVKISKYW